MKAITVWQPWATLIVMGHKTYETRGRNNHIHDTVAIHAAKYRKIPHLVYMQIARAVGISEKDYPGSWLHSLELGEPPEMFGAVLGTAYINGAISTRSAKNRGLCPDFPVKDFTLGDYTDGRWAWGLLNPVQFEKAIPAHGHQGFWNWTPPKA